jgi:surfeit locus 1 family protein
MLDGTKAEMPVASRLVAQRHEERVGKVMSRVKFWLFSLSALAVFVLLVSLGNWQVQRLAWKEQLIADVNNRVAASPEAAPGPDRWADLQPDAAVYRPVRLVGHYDHSHEVHVWFALNEPRGGPLRGPGYLIMTPFITTDGWQVIINRGFVPERQKEAQSRPETLISGDVTLTGLMRFDEPKNWLSPKADKQKNAAYLGMDPATTAPYWVDLLKGQGVPSGLEGASLPQGGETRISFRNSHLQYALTWYGLAAALVVIFLLFLRKSRSKSQPSALEQAAGGK